jgi:hypothetical protein
MQKLEERMRNQGDGGEQRKEGSPSENQFTLSQVGVVVGSGEKGSSEPVDTA